MTIFTAAISLGFEKADDDCNGFVMLPRLLYHYHVYPTKTEPIHST